MKKNLFIPAMAAAILFTACNEMKNESKKDDVIIGKSEIEVKDGLMSPEILHNFGQVSGAQVSVEQGKILYGVSYGDVSLNKRNRELFTINIDGTENTQITKTPKSEGSAQWIKQGTKIAFIYEGQVWEMNPDGSQRTKISDIENGVQDFKYSPDENKILFVSDVKSGERTVDKYPDLEKASGRIVDNLMYKHWDEWVEAIPHPFIADYDEKSLSNIVDILKDEPFESPMKPFGGIEQLDWSPDSKTIAYTCRKKTGLDYTRSTNSDIYFYNIESGETKNMTEGMMGYDMNPKFSSDGKYIAWQSQERDGYESDQSRLFLLNLISGEKSYLTKDFDYDVNDFCWNQDNNIIYIVACVKGTTQLHAVNIENKEITTLTEGQHDYTSVALAGDKLIASRRAMTYPNEIFSVDINSKEAKQVTAENKELLDQIEMGKVEPRWIKTTDNKEMLTWVVYPPKFDPNKKYPAILYCQGGPQNTVSQFWSTRWNLQMMAANGYIVVAPNRRGVPGFGQEWNEQISGDYGGQNMKDYLSAIDAIAKEPFVDEEKLGCTGASYGGFSVFWLAGNHNKRFKAFLAHAGIFNVEAQYLETEEMWFADWDLGGPYWDKSNAIAQRSYANSPHKFVQNWDTPIMITHGELDYRILASQGMMAFNAAQLQGIPSRLLIYPNENHWIAQPQNGVLFQREFFRWFDQWLK